MRRQSRFESGKAIGEFGRPECDLEAIGDARAEVAFRFEFQGVNTTIGAVVMGASGRLTVGEISENVVHGMREGGSATLIAGCLATCIGPIEGAQAVAISLPVFAGQQVALLNADRSFFPLSKFLGGAPVFVLSPNDNTVTVFEIGQQPTVVMCR